MSASILILWELIGISLPPVIYSTVQSRLKQNTAKQFTLREFAIPWTLRFVRSLKKNSEEVWQRRTHQANRIPLSCLTFERRLLLTFEKNELSVGSRIWHDVWRRNNGKKKRRGGGRDGANSRTCRAIVNKICIKQCVCLKPCYNKITYKVQNIHIYI